MVRLRTNFRGDEGYLYRTHWSPEDARTLLVDYLEAVNQLAAAPRSYHAFDHKCTMTIRQHIQHIGFERAWNWRTPVNGKGPELLYMRGVLNTSLPFEGDKLALSVQRLTVYTSPEDRAIGVASRLFASPRGRLGTFGVDDLAGVAQAQVEFSTANVAFVNFTEAVDAMFGGEGFGHSYFRDAPTVASDVVLTLRDDLDPGTPGRPLEPLGNRFWRVPPGYPQLPAEWPATVRRSVVRSPRSVRWGWGK